MARIQIEGRNVRATRRNCIGFTWYHVRPAEAKRLSPGKFPGEILVDGELIRPERVDVYTLFDGSRDYYIATEKSYHI